MSTDGSQKVTASHLKRDAYLYVRQSTARQVFENTESTQRQYGLRQRAIALGWPTDCVIVVDADLGQSGASAVDRTGFQHLVADVGLGRAGILLGLEVSRLARNSTDWHRLLEICALTDTLIVDEDGVYGPAHFNDRLLLCPRVSIEQQQSRGTPLTRRQPWVQAEGAGRPSARAGGGTASRPWGGSGAPLPHSDSSRWPVGARAVMRGPDFSELSGKGTSHPVVW